MNYRHAFHAGNFADVVKHALLVRLLRRLTEKPKPFAVIDTHAGVGLYDLSAEAPRRTGEWREGIGRLWTRDRPLPEALADYLALVRSVNGAEAELAAYPGSPELARRILRPDDRLILNELHGEDHAALRRAMAGDLRVHIHRRDAYELAAALLPPPERRGLLLMDPPFEAPDEFDRALGALAACHRRWGAGVYALWYPVKARGAVDRARGAIANLALPKTLDVGLTVFAGEVENRLNGCGLFVVNPPWRFGAEAGALLATLQSILARDGGRVWADWLVGEREG